MIPVSNTVTRQNYARRDDLPSATLAHTGRLVFNLAAARILPSFGIDKVYLSYESKEQRILTLSDTGQPGIVPYQITFGHTIHMKSFLNLLGQDAFGWIGKYNVELYIPEREDSERVKSSVIVKLTKVKHRE